MGAEPQRNVYLDRQKGHTHGGTDNHPPLSLTLRGATESTPFSAARTTPGRSGQRSCWTEVRQTV